MNIQPSPSFHTNTTISHEKGDIYFNYRSCGIAINRGRVLAVKIAPYDFWIFPGGRVEYLESSKQALEREIHEELHMPCRVVRLLWMVEDFYSFEGQKTHELCHYYLIDFPENEEIYENEQWVMHEEEKTDEKAKQLTFQWIPIALLDTVTLIPQYVKINLDSLPQETSFLIINHLKKENEKS